MFQSGVSFRRGDFAVAFDPATGGIAIEKGYGSNGLDSVELTPADLRDLQEFLRYVVEKKLAPASTLNVFASAPPGKM
jgi:hypothetical protein